MSIKKGFKLPYLLLLVVIISIGFVLSYNSSIKKLNYNQFNVKELSAENVVIPYIKSKHRLPDYYITKNKAREMGWNANQGNLCSKIPGKIIGGDLFKNRENLLPNKKGRVWFEADLNYNCGSRGKDRVIFSNDGLIFVTYNHYKSFEKR
ncbi:ribonuclease [Apibacter muscae]|uniref:Ribonuclease n=1 Tax=Apibacter muscae TaxID=2509004 RepID=A0A563DKN0_9FLAO|nr:ribonuclease domain-containing protein [Apibacter muscae]TWP25121.1 ribonuclease [Apibacter muscae]TWP30669.1 ribonuclease [Apibacter muscae]TWP31212.1 ribonuclease [Apibacter muscae]